MIMIYLCKCLQRYTVSSFYLPRLDNFCEDTTIMFEKFRKFTVYTAQMFAKGTGLADFQYCTANLQSCTWRKFIRVVINEKVLSKCMVRYLYAMVFCKEIAVYRSK